LRIEGDSRVTLVTESLVLYLPTESPRLVLVEQTWQEEQAWRKWYADYQARQASEQQPKASAKRVSLADLYE
jgi:hypothetical protein